VSTSKSRLPLKPVALSTVSGLPALLLASLLLLGRPLFGRLLGLGQILEGLGLGRLELAVYFVPSASSSFC
jgi:hypothetical protein